MKQNVVKGTVLTTFCFSFVFGFLYFCFAKVFLQYLKNIFLLLKGIFFPQKENPFKIIKIALAEQADKALSPLRLVPFCRSSIAQGSSPSRPNGSSACRQRKRCRERPFIAVSPLRSGLALPFRRSSTTSRLHYAGHPRGGNGLSLLRLATFYKSSIVQESSPLPVTGLRLARCPH